VTGRLRDLSLLGSETYSDSPAESNVGILPRETPASLQGGGEGREEWDTREEGVSRPTQSDLGGCGSRQRTVESYIFGLQPVSKKKDHHQEKGASGFWEAPSEAFRRSRNFV